MAWKPDYLTAAELKTYLRITGSEDDALIASCVTAASRAVDHACGRQFGKLAAAAARLYSAEGLEIDGRGAVEIDDLMTTTNLAVTMDGTTITNGTDFDLWPRNAAADVKPWTHLLLRTGEVGVTIGAWSSRPGHISVTAIFGWTAVPALVVTATQMQAARFYARRNATFGIAGSPDQGSELRLLERLDPDVAVALKPLRRTWTAV